MKTKLLFFFLFLTINNGYALWHSKKEKNYLRITIIGKINKIYDQEEKIKIYFVETNQGILNCVKFEDDSLSCYVEDNKGCTYNISDNYFHILRVTYKQQKHNAKQQNNKNK